MKKNILIAGGTGLIGSRLCQILDKKYSIYILTRGTSRTQGDITFCHWNIDNEIVEFSNDIEFDAVINLTGAGIADKRWTEARKKVLIDSRTRTTQLLAKKMAELKHKPKVYVGASAIGFYGNRGDEKLDEGSSAGLGFLSECCELWEKAHEEVRPYVERYSLLRIGIVLSRKGGALPKLILPARLGGSGYFGNGKAYYPWIHIDDVCGMILSLVENDHLSGVYNGTSNEPERLKDIAKAIKKVFASYALTLPVPSMFLKIGLGEMSEMLLNSTRVYAPKWTELPFPYKYPSLLEALQDLKEREV